MSFCCISLSWVSYWSPSFWWMSYCIVHSAQCHSAERHSAERHFKDSHSFVHHSDECNWVSSHSLCSHSAQCCTYKWHGSNWNIWQTFTKLSISFQEFLFFRGKLLNLAKRLDYFLQLLLLKTNEITPHYVITMSSDKNWWLLMRAPIDYVSNY